MSSFYRIQALNSRSADDTGADPGIQSAAVTPSIFGVTVCTRIAEFCGLCGLADTDDICKFASLTLMSSRNHVIMQLSTDVISKFVMHSVHNWPLHCSVSEVSMNRCN